MEALKRSMERIPAKKETRNGRGDKEEKEGFRRLSAHSRAQLPRVRLAREISSRVPS